MNSIIYMGASTGMDIIGNDKFVTGAAISEIVGGYFQAIELTERYTLWVNEDYSSLDEVVLNPLAVLVWNRYFGQAEPIFGNAVVTGGSDEHGNTLSLTANETYVFIQDLLTNEV